MNAKKKLADFKKAFGNYKQERKLASDQFKYCDLFLYEIMPILRNLTRSHREGNWQLHLSAVRRALELFFAFDRTNYSRWIPLYYEDCVALEKIFHLCMTHLAKVTSSSYGSHYEGL